jgi:hypothetical protein
MREQELQLLQPNPAHNLALGGGFPQQQQQVGAGGARAVTTPRQQVTLQPFMGQLQMLGGSGQLAGAAQANLGQPPVQQQSPHPQQHAPALPGSASGAGVQLQPPVSSAQMQQLLQSPGRCGAPSSVQT